MQWIGQHFIMNQLKRMLVEWYVDPTLSANVLFRGPSGYGKTTLAVECCRYLADNEFEVYWADSKPFRFSKRVILIDEVHRINGLEMLFPVMDSREHLMFFCTNADATLPEAFVNRTYDFMMDDYNDDELLLIIVSNYHFNATDAQLLEIVNAGNRNPRIIKSLCDRLEIIFRGSPELNTQQTDYRELLAQTFGITDGITTLARRYLEVLDRIGGTASLSMLQSILHVDSGTIKNTVEPVLASKGLIKITSRGRSLIES